MKIKKSFTMFLLFFLLVIAASIPVSAATVTKVTYKANYTRSTQQTTIYGKDKYGRNVWTFKSRVSPATELVSCRCVATSKYVFVIDGNMYLRLNKANGRILARNRFDAIGCGSAIMKVDCYNNLYVMGYYGSYMYKINPYGKVLWRKSFSNTYFWPTKISLNSSRKVITINFDCCGRPKTYSFRNK